MIEVTKREMAFISTLPASTPMKNIRNRRVALMGLSKLYFSFPLSMYPVIIPAINGMKMFMKHISMF